MIKKAIGLFSGGLDSCLAVKLMLEQGFQVICLSFDLWSHPKRKTDHPLRPRAEALGAEFMTVDLSDEFPSVLRCPRWGYGSVINPCLDCKLLMLQKAAEIMPREGAQIVFTGEVLGQRPMTQTRTMMNMLEKQSGLKGRLLRPLCAKFFPPTIPEIEGLIERDRLLDIHGRGRRRQIDLATHYNLDDYPTPAGGCVLTQKDYGAKVHDMMRHTDKPLDAETLELLKTGRHFRISPAAKLVVGRDEKDNMILEGFRNRRISLQPAVTLGPLALLEGNPSDTEIETAARITARYTKEKRSECVKISIFSDGNKSELDVKPLTDPEMTGYRLSFDKKRLHNFWKDRIREKGIVIKE